MKKYPYLVAYQAWMTISVDGPVDKCLKSDIIFYEKPELTILDLDKLTEYIKDMEWENHYKKAWGQGPSPFTKTSLIARILAVTKLKNEEEE